MVAHTVINNKENNKMNTKELEFMLTYKRPHGSYVLSQFINRWLVDIKGADRVFRDGFNNVIAVVGYYGAVDMQAESFVGLPTAMFSSHIDTVHRSEGYQQITMDENTVINVTPDGETNCLGSDDAVGIWLMLGMIEAGVKGVYIFHQGEERGGLGSSYIADNYPNFLNHFDMAVAFDRRGYSDVITHQGTRCCSDIFAKSLSDELGMNYRPNDSGVFTDTANYAYDIPECTNVSVGYDNEHTLSEKCDLKFAEALLGKLVRVKWSLLPIDRDVRDNDYAELGWWDEKEWDNDLDVDQYVQSMTLDTAKELVYAEPETAIDLLVELSRERF